MVFSDAAQDQLGSLYDQALEKLGQAANTADQKARDASYAAAVLTGSVSTYNAIQEDARQTRKLYDIMRAKRNVVVAQGQDAVVIAIRDMGQYANIDQLVAAAQMLNLGNIAKTTVTPTLGQSTTLILGGVAVLAALILIRR